MKLEKNMKRKSLMLFILLMTGSLTATAETGLVQAKSGLSLRASPAAKGQLLQKLTDGTSVEILDKKGPAAKIEGVKSNWFKVTAQGKTGWVFGGFIRLAAAKPVLPPEKTKVPEKESVPATSDTESEYSDFDFVGSEKAVLKKFPAKVTRKQKSLQLKCAAGKNVELINDETENESCVMYYCLDYIQPEGLFLIYAQMYEGCDHFFVTEASGKTVSLGEMPIFSPARSRVAVSGFDITAAYDFNGIKIFKIDKGELQLEFELQPENWGPQDFHWESETAAKFNQVSVVDGLEAPKKPARLTLEPVSGKWQIQTLQ